MSFEIDGKTMREIQQKSFDMAQFFVDFCKNNGLMCYFCGGCCIGAVRGGGFVPWDDDIDFFMPRPDYERLIEIFNQRSNSDRYFLQVTSDDVITKSQFATICDNDTTYIKTYMADLDINHGLSLDIIPLDGRPPKGRFYSIRRKLQNIYALAYSLFIIGEAPENHGRLVNAAAKIILGIFRAKSVRRRLWKFAQKKMTRYDFYKSDYVCELTTGPVYMRRDYPREWFAAAINANFESAKMPIPAGYDKYLTMAFGDYMTEPPEDERTYHHDYEFIDMSTPYTKYKGTYYCKGVSGK